MKSNKITVPAHRNPYAEALRTTFRKRVTRNRKAYTRKGRKERGE